MATVPPETEIDYPTTDGRPMAETELHRDLMIDVIETLKDHFDEIPDVHVSGNLMIYYEEGQRSSRAPDAFVVFGMDKGFCDVYKVWEEGKYPDWVLEITSKTTRREDQDEKLTVYRDVWKVKEYFLFDPLEEWLRPSMQGHRLVEGEYVSLEMADGQLRSEVLDLILERESYRLRFRNPVTGQLLMRRDAGRARRAELERELAQAKADHAEAELDMARMELAHERRVIAERDAELAQLRRELEALRQPPQPGGS